ncbi:uncharacterized protein [Henckelia pumila]|uniref:uncharacterized protein n=1 Tax=Henckelia pumila TaxID=405737 RepID=UPI003C6DC1D9
MSNSETAVLRKDPTWNYGTLVDPKNTNKMKCNFCGKITNGGIYRHKKHLVGGNRNTKTCPKCPDHVKEEIGSYMSKRKEVKHQMDVIPHFVEVAEQQEYLAVEEAARSERKRPISIGKCSNHSPDFQRKKLKQTGPIDLYFRKDVDEIVQHGKKKDGKLYDENKKQLRENALQRFARWMYDAGIPFNVVNYDSFKPFIEVVGQFGTGMKPPTYHEVRVTCLKKELHHTKLILKDYMDDHVKYDCTLMDDGWTDMKNRTFINCLVNGPRGSVFIESVDGSSYSHIGVKLFELFDKYVQQIGENNVVQVVTDSASANVLVDLMLEGFFYNFSFEKVYERAMMASLKKMFTSEKWITSRFAKETQGKRATEVILMPSFWNVVVYAVKVGGPVVKVLRLVDGEKKPPMGYIYEAIDRAKEFFYLDSNIENDNEVVTGLYKCIARMCGSEDLQDKIMDQLPMYKRAEGLFAMTMAIRQRNKKSPAEWWLAYGCLTSELQQFAVKLKLFYTKYVHLHSKRRNRLEQKRLNDLVYIKCNRALRRRYDMCDMIDPLSLDDIDDSNEWLTGGISNNSDGENYLVFDDDSFTWSEVARASGVGEDAYSFRYLGSSFANQFGEATTIIRRHNDTDEEEEEHDLGETNEDSEGYKSGNSDSGDDDAIFEEDEEGFDDLDI